MAWLSIIAINILALLGLVYGFMVVTDRYIAEKRKVTLIYDIHPLRQKVMRPNQTFTWGDTRISINRHGMRGAPPPIPKAAGVCRIITMGGSSVFDYFLPNGQSWSESLASNLESAWVPGVESFNAGVSGYSSRQTLAFYHDKVRFFEPDIVIFYQGWNDAKYLNRFRESADVDRFFYVGDYRDKYRFLTAPRPMRNWYAAQMMIEDYGKTSQQLFEGVDPRWPVPSAPPPRNAATPSELRSVWSETPGMQYWKKNVEAFVFTVLSDGATPVLVAQATLAAPHSSEKARRLISYGFVKLDHENLLAANEAMVDVLRDIAERFGVPFIDLREEMNGHDEYFADHVHMFPKGSQQFSKLLAEKLPHHFAFDAGRCQPTSRSP
jgi:lysophospholipase L1-like esterase